MAFLKNPVGEKSFGRIFFVYKIPKEKIPFGDLADKGNFYFLNFISNGKNIF